MTSRTAVLFAIVLTLSLVSATAAEGATEQLASAPEACQQAELTPFDVPTDIEQPLFLDSCSAENDCSQTNGMPISCTGSSSCSVQFCSVTCDGVRTYCCDISELECPQRACVYCHCRFTGGGAQECSDQACMIFPF
jgi:hypothetical protein